jgi:hypothetical protein
MLAESGKVRKKERLTAVKKWNLEKGIYKWDMREEIKVKVKIIPYLTCKFFFWLSKNK